MNLLWCPLCTFYCPIRKKSTLFFQWGQMYTFSRIFIKKIETFVLTLHYSAKVIFDLEKKTNKEFNCVMVFVMRPSSTQFEIPICFWFQRMSLSNLFLTKFWNFLVLYLGCGCMTFDSMTQMTSSHLLPHADKWKTWVQRPPNIFQNVEKDM